MTDEPTADALSRVRAFLESFYRDEEFEDRGTTNALRGESADRQERWRNAQAFERVLAADLPEGTLQQLVFRSAGRDVLSDEEAREFLERVYDGNAFDVAVDWDTLG
ncbi:hypothetical protein [Actinoplanes sp. NBRC 103695]|uniref:hypothetical protein n=1 Tax=Actinoplanes sp. NBRC 103695 TaxID=3032202 RepID=UPI0024A085F0|nr:hypothetical protein [Actinoplanes sp. NBRC 103695]GLY94147.1 hypothetical protein Acsp02_14030 [Actinoplanes sp. NBRC 103695]